jgi:methyl-accepting chemotaxis protein
MMACAQVPKESVELSVTVGRDLTEVHRAHRELVMKYFDRMKKDINDFIDEVYRPFQIKHAMEDFRLVERIQQAAQATSGPDALQIMELFVTNLTEQIESYRNELLGNISQQETEVVTAVDDAYQNIQNANAIVTGHLASIRKVHDAQEELLRRVNLEDFRHRVTRDAVSLSDKIEDLTVKARKGEESVDKAIDQLRKLTGRSSNNPP